MAEKSPIRKMAVWPRSWKCFSLRRTTVWPRVKVGRGGVDAEVDAQGLAGFE